MAPSVQLLGPPEIHNSSAISNPTSSDDPSVDLLVENINKTKLPVKPRKGLTENQSPTFLSTGDPCLDLFFHVVPDSPPKQITYLLDLAWKHEPLTTLKLVCNLRGVRGTGKLDKEGFYTAALWLQENHPKSLASNLKWIAQFGYLKDFPEILYRLINTQGVEFYRQKFKGRFRIFKGKRFYPGTRKKSDDVSKSQFRLQVPREKRMAAEAKKVEIRKENAREIRKDKLFAMAKRAVERYNRDPDYRLLHDQTSQLFAELLVSDLLFLKVKRFKEISLASKWCPSLDSSYDKCTLLCESIARKVFPRESYPEYEGIEDGHYAYRVRDRLRKEVLVPLRRALELPEIYMSLQQWDSLPYNRVASVAMKTYKKIFLEKDQSRFMQYLDDAKSGKATIAAGALLPHEIVAGLTDVGEVAELQWKRMVDDLAKNGKFTNCLPICDVSGSMNGTPMEVCVALGLLISELSEPPWNGKVITFSHDPKLHHIQGENLVSKTDFVRKMDWGTNTNFQKVFDLILQVAVQGRLRKEKMLKKVFVFSDMEFDKASENKWETDYEAIKRKFREKGYGSSVPEIVFWNLRSSRATPVPSDQKGVALVSGFSKNLLTLFMNGDGIINPLAAMEMAIAGPEYHELVVED